MKNQVLSIEQMQKLKELGVDVSKASMCYIGKYPSCDFDDGDSIVVVSKDFNKRLYNEFGPAFTLQDIIELLPTTIHTDGGLFYLTIMRTCIFYYFIYEDDNRILNKEFDDCIMQSAYEMLVWVAENGYLTSK